MSSLQQGASSFGRIDPNFHAKLALGRVAQIPGCCLYCDKCLREISNNCMRFASEFDKLQNLPVIDAGASILAALNRMEGTLNSRFDALEARFDARFDALETRQLASEQNAISRIQNSYLESPNSPLAPFHNVQTNTVIPNFPSTTHDLGRLNAGQLDTILEPLGLSIGGNTSQKRERLRVYMGLRRAAV
ncbi:hypothetical protein P152DRAFT_17471 [Eremomyces bilateralis CBS 781.70]|uniref:SAP domain-containing protein n=1 Tax=Eremomyces bilateralis CBS 781.70 TaxID=1392243 RepID=A0A6G1GH05_9PEZI|nr:uncharacterized protein P152DRAFT_17471 [Eremomyces bilateralis CBS 781.70]KAF1817385.1 hypothetical protein P152DRAFT_17471 [Eremomyces bilateralis CBS 781.70]